MHMACSSFFGDIAEDDPVGKEMVEFPVSAYLVEGPEGRVLYDCDCHPNAMKPQSRWYESFQLQFPWSAGEDGEVCHLPNRLELFRNSQVIVYRHEYEVALAYHKRKEPDSSYAWQDTEQ